MEEFILLMRLELVRVVYLYEKYTSMFASNIRTIIPETDLGENNRSIIFLQLILLFFSRVKMNFLSTYSRILPRIVWGRQMLAFHLDNCILTKINSSKLASFTEPVKTFFFNPFSE